MLEHRNIADKDAAGSSDKSFGIVFAVVFALIALFPILHGQELRSWALGMAAVFAFFALCIPCLLAPLNVIWTKFGGLLHHIMNPIILGGLFFIVVTPIGLIMRGFGKRTLSLNTSEQASYWIERNPPGPAAESFNNQF